MMKSGPIGRALAGAVLVGTTLACANQLPKDGNGVNDVRLACEIRTKWVRTGNDCDVCEAGVVAPHCDCSSLKAFSAACLDQANARSPVCPESIDNCVNACNRTDCNCIDACYATDARCKSASAARDGCITDACADHCK
jgi:hypothetical protein